MKVKKTFQLTNAAARRAAGRAGGDPADAELARSIIETSRVRLEILEANLEATARNFAEAGYEEVRS